MGKPAGPQTDAGRRLLRQIYDSPLRLPDDARLDWRAWITMIETEAAALNVESLARAEYIARWREWPPRDGMDSLFLETQRDHAKAVLAHLASE